MIEQIRDILKRHFLNRSLSYNPLDELDAAAQAIAKLIERQPVDLVRAMAATIYRTHTGDYRVQGDGVSCLVWKSNGKLYCGESSCFGNCPHIQAVELYLAAQS